MVKVLLPVLSLFLFTGIFPITNDAHADNHDKEISFVVSRADQFSSILCPNMERGSELVVETTFNLTGSVVAALEALSQFDANCRGRGYVTGATSLTMRLAQTLPFNIICAFPSSRHALANAIFNHTGRITDVVAILNVANARCGE